MTVNEVADLTNVKVDTLYKQIQNGYIVSMEVDDTGRGGKSGKQYRIPLSSLDPKYQKKYYKLQRDKNLTKVEVKEVEEEKHFDNYTEEERSQIVYWKSLLEKWDDFRHSGGKKVERDNEFIKMWNITHDHKMSLATLKRRWKRYREIGDAALIENRGKKNKGKTNIDPLAWAVFEQYYLSEERSDISHCYKLVEEWAKMDHPELLPLASYRTYSRAAEKIPYAVVQFFRYGKKAAEDKALPHIKRIYENLHSNEIWVADNHTFDVITKYDDGIEKTHRLYVTAYQDVRSRKMVGTYVTNTPDSDANLYCLKKAIQKYGIPEEIYTDNGREFLVHDIGGRGRLKTKVDGEHKVPTILSRLGIKFTNAKVRNGRAKIVERGYKQFKNEFSKLINTYTGGHILERPESLKDKVKAIKSIITDSDFKEAFYTYVEGWYNEQPQWGEGMNGKSANEVYQEKLLVKRTASNADLNLMLMRSTRIQTVNRMGVKLKLYGQDMYYWNEDLILNFQKQKVYLRYDPESVGTVRVYDEKDRFLCTAENKEALTYNASKEDIKKASADIKRVERTVKNYLKEGSLDIFKAPDKLDVMLRRANMNIAEQMDPTAKVLEVVRAEETESMPLLDKVMDASGHEVDHVEVDINKMVKNFRKNKKPY
jgi:transposase InsO family protein